ncbi:ParB/RepB/Spo0J family partition protein [Streptomyces sp. NBC_01422]|uniref:ParB/RepB/Spo0J family partition protein n=1 Tax=Streptomyces sp. NBC_01422 TaxID=2903859 RepID=UPI002E2AAAD7|nr:ParB/RepB/Spo0J family partition protein [Streptomyces sp. NBC_01422]
MKDIPLRPTVAPRKVPIGKVAPNPRNLREDDLWTNDEERDETVASMQSSDILQALLVSTLGAFLDEYPQYKKDEALAGVDYVIIAGHRRYAAAQLAGLTEVRIDLRDELIPVLDLVMLEENLKRKGLNVFQEGEGYRRLAIKGESHASIAKKVGKGKSTITKRIALLDLPDDARQAVLAKQVSVDTAYNLIVALDGDLSRFLEAAEIMRRGRVTATDAVNKLYETGSARTDPEPTPAGPGTATEARISEEPVLSEPTAATATMTEEPATSTAPVPSARTEPVLPEPTHDEDTSRESAQPELTGEPSTDAMTADHADNGRAQSNAARNRFCQNLIASTVDLAVDPQNTQIAAMALGHATSGAIVKAHGWMKAAEAADAAAFEAESYRDAILVREDANLIARLAYAVALAQAEVRASSRRRNWDYRDIAHLRHLIDGGYEPTDWERQHLG